MDKYDSNKYPTINAAWVELWGEVTEDVPADADRRPWRECRVPANSERPTEIRADNNMVVCTIPEEASLDSIRLLCLAVNNYEKVTKAVSDMRQQYAELLVLADTVAHWPDIPDGFPATIESMRQCVANIRGEEIKYVQVYPRDDSKPVPHGPTKCAVIEINSQSNS